MADFKDDNYYFREFNTNVGKPSDINFLNYGDNIYFSSKLLTTTFRNFPKKNFENVKIDKSNNSNSNGSISGNNSNDNNNDININKNNDFNEIDMNKFEETSYVEKNTRNAVTNNSNVEDNDNNNNDDDDVA